MDVGRCHIAEDYRVVVLRLRDEGGKRRRRRIRGPFPFPPWGNRVAGTSAIENRESKFLLHIVNLDQADSGAAVFARQDGGVGTGWD